MHFDIRLSILSSLNDNKQARKQLKDNQEEINKESKFLFGENFQSQLKACAKAQKSADELLSRSGKRKLSATDNRPNQAGSSSSTNNRPTGGESSWSARGGRNKWRKGKDDITSPTVGQEQSMAPSKLTLGSSIPKRSFFKRLRDKLGPVSRQVKVFHKKLGENNCRPEHLKDCERLKTSTERQTSSTEGAKSDSNEE